MTRTAPLALLLGAALFAVAPPSSGHGEDAEHTTLPRTARPTPRHPWIEKVESFRESLAKLVSRGYPEDALKAVLLGGLTDKKALADTEKVAAVAEVLEASGFHEVATGPEEEHGTRFVSFRSRRDGVTREVRVDWALATTVDFRALAAIIIGTLNPIFQVGLSQAGFDSAASLGRVVVLLVVIGFLQFRPNGLLALRSRT